MYSRYPNYRFSGGVRIPENYSGNAFGTIEETDDRSVPEQREETPEAEEVSAKEVRADLRTSVEASETKRPRPRFPSFGFSTGRLFSGGIGFEELLIIGLILLIAQGGADDDIILLLALLLFVG